METTIAEIAESRGISLDTLRKRWKVAFPQIPFDKFRELSDAEIAEIAEKPIGRKSARKARNHNSPILDEFAALGTESERLQMENQMLLSALEKIERERAAEPFDFRVFAARTGLWLITAAQIGLVMYGCFARFGNVGLVVAAIPSVFLVVVNITATDARFWGTTDTGFWVSVALATVFGTLHFFTFRDLLDLDGSAAFWFCGVSATVVECVALAALSLQSKISNEK